MIVYPIQKKDGIYYLILASTEKKVMDDIENQKFSIVKAKLSHIRNIICSYKKDDAK